MSSQSRSGLFLWEAFGLISNTTILGVLYGIAFTLYCFCARLSYLQLQDPDKRRQARFTLAHTSLIIICTTALLVSSAWLFQMVYINHANDPGGPLTYQGSMSTAIGSGDFVIGVFTMAIQIWRLWVVWSGTRYAVAVTILPLLYLFAYIGLIVFLGIETRFLTYASPGRITAITTADFAVVSTFTILVTGLVTARLLLARRRHTRIMGSLDAPSPYISIIAVLVESYALDSVWSIGAAISAGIGSPSLFLFINNDAIIKVIAYLLVIYRVAAGRGWTKETEQQLTSLQWNRSAQTTTDETSGIQSQVSTTVVVLGTPPISHSESVV